MFAILVCSYGFMYETYTSFSQYPKVMTGFLGFNPLTYANTLFKNVNKLYLLVT